MTEDPILYERHLTDRHSFQIVCHSIIKEPVEAIVNPANEYLMHSGGLAGLISRAGGPAIQRESDAKAPLATGEAIFPTAGDLPFRYIIHTVGPIWRGGKTHEPVLLDRAIRASLLCADGLQLTSLSMPAVSTGIFAYPIELATPIIVQAIAAELPRCRYLLRVRLCDNEPLKASLMAMIAQEAH